MEILYRYLNNISYLNDFCFDIDPIIFPLILQKKLLFNSNSWFKNQKNLDSIDFNVIDSKINQSYEYLTNSTYYDFLKINSNNISNESFKNNDILSSFKVVEFTAFFSSLFAFGSRKFIISFLANLFSTISPFDITGSKPNFFDPQNKENIEIFSKLPYYRWVNKKILFLLLAALNEFYCENDSILHFIIKKISIGDSYSNLNTKVQNANNLEITAKVSKNKNIQTVTSKPLTLSTKPLISYMILFSNDIFKRIIALSNKNLNLKINNKDMKILKNLLVQDLKGSSAKRYNLFLKWMIKDTFPDTNLWNYFITNHLNFFIDPFLYTRGKRLNKSSITKSDDLSAVMLDGPEKSPEDFLLNKEDIIDIFNKKNLFFPLDVHILKKTKILFLYSLESTFYFLYDSEDNNFFEFRFAIKSNVEASEKNSSSLKNSSSATLSTNREPIIKSPDNTATINGSSISTSPDDTSITNKSSISKSDKKKEDEIKINLCDTSKENIEIFKLFYDRYENFTDKNENHKNNSFADRYKSKKENFFIDAFLYLLTFYKKINKIENIDHQDIDKSFDSKKKFHNFPFQEDLNGKNNTIEPQLKPNFYKIVSQIDKNQNFSNKASFDGDHAKKTIKNQQFVNQNSKIIEQFQGENKIYLLFLEYLYKHKDFFEKALKTNDIFKNSYNMLSPITDFYRIFDQDDPLIFDLPLSILTSSIFKEKLKTNLEKID